MLFMRDHTRHHNHNGTVIKKSPDKFLSATPSSPRTAVLLSLPRNAITSQQQQQQHHGHNNNNNGNSSGLVSRSVNGYFDPDRPPFYTHWSLYRTYHNSSQRTRLLAILALIALIIMLAVIIILVLWSQSPASEAVGQAIDYHEADPIQRALRSPRWTLPECSSYSGSHNTKCSPYEIKTEEGKVLENEEQIAMDNHWSGVQPIDYDIELNMVKLKRKQRAPPIDYENQMEFSGVVRMSFRVMTKTNRIMIHADARSILISSVEVQSLCGTRIMCVKGVSLEHKGDHVTINLVDYLTVGEFYTLKIVFDGVNFGYKAGLYVTQTASTVGVSTIFQMRYARLVMPCIDHPALKAKFKLCITHQPDHTAYSNTPALHTHIDNLVSFTCFERTVPLPTYVFSFSVVENYINESIGVGNGKLPDLQVLFTHDMASNKPEWVLPEAAQRLQRMIKMVDMPYVMSKIDILLQPTPYWGIENMGLIAIDSYHATQPQYTLAHTILTHEVIHMWLGNVFTISSWSQICLQEGLTAYLEWVITDETNLKDLRTVIETKFPAAIADSDSPPIITEFRLTQQIADYCFTKPPLIFHMIRAAFGANVWFDFMKTMAKEYTFSHAGLNEWTKALSKVTNDQRAGEMLRVWFTQGGFPLMLVDRTTDGSVRLRQRQVKNNTHIRPVEQPFPFRVNYLDHTGSEISGWMGEENLTISDPTILTASQSPDYHFVFDANMNVFGRFVYTASNYDAMLNACIRKRATAPNAGRGSLTGKLDSCQLDLHQINFLLDDLCWAIQQNVVPQSNDESVSQWSSVLSTITEFSQRGSAQRLISVNSLCSCCTKTRDDILNEPGHTPWNPGCRFTWNRTCRELKLMKHLNRTEEITNAQVPKW